MSARKHDLHRTNQSVPGFPEVVPIRGVKLWGVHHSYPGDEVRSVVPSRRVDEIPPRYRPARHRSAEALAAAWRRVEAAFPGIDRAYLTLLIVARGFAESGAGPVPILLVTGPTGASKSTTVAVAAAVVGDSVASIKEDKRERFTEALGERAPGNGFLLLDEFAKDAPGAAGRAMFNLLLDVTREYTYRRLYAGPTVTALNSVLVITNNAYGQDVTHNAQLGRRLIHVPLVRRAPARWEDTCGTRDARYWRTDAANAEACDLILSNIVDRHLPPADAGALNLVDVARELGFGLLEDAREQPSGVTVEELARDLYRAICEDAPDAPDRWRGRGWKLIMFDAADELAQLWRALCDDPTSTDGWGSSMRLAELDLGAVLGAPHPVRLELSRHGRRLGLRFASGDTRGRAAEAARINEEILAPPGGAAPLDAPSDAAALPDLPDLPLGGL